MSEMRWETLSVDGLKPAAYNPRKKLKKGDKEYEKIKKARVSAYRYFEYDIPPEVMMAHKVADLGYSNCGTYIRKKENEK